ncbi:LacI family DNA-binding transcriptional regulator [Marinitenerispora sediminis]|uniref:LacI family transcriptional regulator n=2 Tax=Marinitenerispora sediminis TaxID=1931232 RepID=A0A368T7W9_9ACTN|nr:LacI family DNA-binding transcriptional regulator [Marinitenerispora sediminis]RCV51160.1 LacI family transcriptional regulator [Marinitenerispora sediminis]RCV57065.1 LacI family transcriptional regulator [Marinitenerispora sediminis]RCV59954.1 LacI family transcriptional regulator [Marinitenerispora sediminis]
MSDVARRAGVSLSTVSRALRGAPGVSPAVRAKVARAAAELSYVVSRDASSLVTGATGRVAAIVPFLRPWFFGAALAGISAELRAAGLDMLVYEVGDAEGLDSYVRALPLRRNVDAVIAVSLDLDDRETKQLDEIGVPVVYCSQRAEGRPSVFIDNAAAAAAATRFLLNLGHRRIAYVQSRDETGFSWISRHRRDGYLQAMAEAGAEAVVVTERDGPRGGAAAAARLLGAPNPPTALFAESDDVAMGALGVLRRSRVPVPEAVSVVGFDNHDVAEVLDLTTVAQPVSELGAAAARLAARLLRGGADPAEHVLLPTELVVRRSASAPRTAPGPTPEIPTDRRGRL